MGQFLQQLINGIQIGSIYALIALGYTMVYGIVRLINFAHADIFMVGAYMGFFLAPVMAKVFGGAFIPTIIAAMLITGLLGFVMEKLAYRPLRYKSRLSALITALGVSIFLENFCAPSSSARRTARSLPSSRPGTFPSPLASASSSPTYCCSTSVFPSS
jgi:branched-subunit amino acid ABC-type transport system permease component